MKKEEKLVIDVPNTKFGMTAPNCALHIDKSGSIGGGTSPAEKLHIFGEVKEMKNGKETKTK